MLGATLTDSTDTEFERSGGGTIIGPRNAAGHFTAIGQRFEYTFEPQKDSANTPVWVYGAAESLVYSVRVSPSGAVESEEWYSHWWAKDPDWKARVNKALLVALADRHSDVIGRGGTA